MAYPDGVPLAGAAGKFITAPDSAALDITGDIELVCLLKASNWASGQMLMSKWKTGSLSWNLQTRGSAPVGALQFFWSANGSTSNSALAAVPTFTNGVAYWIKLTFDVDNGAAGRTATFYTAAYQVEEPSSWSTLSTVTSATVTSIFAGTSKLGVGGDEAGAAVFNGNVLRAIVREGIGGTVKADFDHRLSGPTGYTDAYGNVWTVSL